MIYIYIYIANMLLYGNTYIILSYLLEIVLKKQASFKGDPKTTGS